LSPNGLPGLTFDGLTQFLNGPATFSNSSGNAISLFMAVRLDAATSSTGSYPMMYTYESAEEELRGSAATGKAEMVRGANVVDSGASIVGTWQRASAIWRNDNTFQLWLNGSSQGSSTNAHAIPTTSTTAGIGARHGGTLLCNCSVLEILQYNNDVGSTAQGNIESYFSSKYGI
jgi:hypothetical protein